MDDKKNEKLTESERDQARIIDIGRRNEFFTIGNLNSIIFNKPITPVLLGEVRALMVEVAKEKDARGFHRVVDVELLECEAFLGAVRIKIFGVIGM